jgi:hypothetical protein
MPQAAHHSAVAANDAPSSILGAFLMISDCSSCWLSCSRLGMGGMGGRLARPARLGSADRSKAGSCGSCIAARPPAAAPPSPPAAAAPPKGQLGHCTAAGCCWAAGGCGGGGAGAPPPPPPLPLLGGAPSWPQLRRGLSRSSSYSPAKARLAQRLGCS